MTEIEVFAKHYRGLGLNVTCISEQTNDYNRQEKNLLKAPNHSYSKYFNTPQTSEEFNAINWGNAVGVGTVAQYQNVFVLDFDGCRNNDLIADVLEFLKLPRDYEWVVETGSKHGYHLYLTIDKFPTVGINYAVTELTPKLSAFPFEKIEILWKTHVVLPPSKHKSGSQYRFANCFVPAKVPAQIRQEQIMEFIREYSDIKNVNHRLAYYDLNTFVQVHETITDKSQMAIKNDE